MLEIFVLGDDNQALLSSISPDSGIAGVLETDILNVFGIVSQRRQMPRKGGRKLVVNQEFQAAMRIWWLFANAA